MEEGSFTSASGPALRTCTWRPGGPPRALVFLCHGYGELLTPYYDEVAAAGTGRELLCFGHDHTGHGKSEGERVQVGDMAEYVAPVLAHCQAMAEKHPGLPLYIVGHSMGGLIALLAVLGAQEAGVQFAGMVLMGPLIQLDPKVAGPCMKFLAMVASKVWPGLTLQGLDSKLVTSDVEWREHKDSDPLHYHGGAKALHGHVLIQALDSLPKQFSEISLPYLILHGAEDKICSPEGSAALHAATTSTDRTLELVPGASHNLFLEPKPVSVPAVARTMDWITDRL